jgi:hypothetical protein
VAPKRRDSDGNLSPETTRDEARPIPDHAVRRAMQLIDTSGLLKRIDGWRADERRGKGGRPETFPIRALLVAMLLCAMQGEPLLATCFTDVLFRRISPSMREVLGVPDSPEAHDHHGWRAVYRNVRTRLHGLLRLIDPSATPKNRRFTHERFIAILELRQAGLTDAQWHERRNRLTWFVNVLLDMSFNTLPRDIRRRWRGSIGIDATVVPAYARHDRRARRRRRDKVPEVFVHSADPDADWYVRGELSPDADSGPSARSVWGFEATVAVTGPDVDGDSVFPSLVIGMAPLHKPSHEPGKNATCVLRSIQDRGHPAGYVAGDRAYTNAKPEDFQLPARALGYSVVLAYGKHQLGIKDSYNGMLLIEGAWYCPCIPEVLINATIDFEAGKIDEITYRARLVERWRYRILPKADAGGGHRKVRCPASNPSPMARCDLKPGSVRPETRGRLRIPLRDDLIAFAPKICTQQSITLPPEYGAKYWQELLFGSEKWHAVYSTLRNSVEGFNGFVKDGAHEALDDPERRRIRGVAAQSVFVAFLLAAANLRKIRTFVAELTAQAAGVLKRLAPRRRTRDLSTWLPEGQRLSPLARGRPPSETA